ncbi:universal stress protein, partial [Natronospira sp.]|uniref:universal stress protein n=1 Tax=Natronospira sp. TaxID=2024970 RepID=UPI003873B7F1
GTKEIILVWVDDVRNKSKSAQMQELNQTNLNIKKEKIEKMGFEVNIETPRGIPAAEINQIAKAKYAELIVIASRGKNLIRDFFIGSTTAALIRSSNTPVLVERVKVLSQGEQLICDVEDQIFSRIMLATDFSPRAKGAENIAKELSTLAETIGLVSIIDEGSTPEELQQKREAAFAYLENIRTTCQDKCPNIDVFLEEGVASKQILSLAQSFGASLIVMGTRGKGQQGKILLGSTAETVARRASCAVLLVP